MKTFTLEQARAYAIGYYDGRSFGKENNGFTDDLHHAYGLGYQAGITDYCQYDAEEN